MGSSVDGEVDVLEPEGLSHMPADVFDRKENEPHPLEWEIHALLQEPFSGDG